MLRWCVMVSLLAGTACAQDVVNGPQGEQIPGPKCAEPTQWNSDRPTTCSAADAENYLHDIEHWRTERRVRVGLDGSQASREYDRPELRWAQSSFIQPQMMVHDRFFYDPVAARYTVDRYLADVGSRYGGIDSVLVWHTYPNIGIDDRSQFDLFRDLPGGEAGVRAMVDDFHRAGVHVLFPVMVWDRGTHPEDGTDADALAKELTAIGADGVNGDTLDGIPRTFQQAAVARNHPLALEPEGGFASDESVADNTMSWGYWKYGFIPAISRYKWLETRHMVNVCNRWAHTHLDDLQYAFFNGSGFESWENIWGIWNQLTPRDAETVRRIAAIDRVFGENLVSRQWEPHTHTTNFGVFASKWSGRDGTLWTFINRNAYEVAGEQIRLPFRPGVHYYDLWHGAELESKRRGDEVVLSFSLEANGYGAILASASPLTKGQTALLARMRETAGKPLSAYSAEWRTLPQQLVPIEGTATMPARADGREMVSLPEAEFRFRVNGIEIEGMNEEGVDVQYPWEPAARRYHDHTLHIAAFRIDKYPVTNADFKKFLDNARYHPADAHNFLRDWHGREYPAGAADRPVTWVSLEDARAYARWAGKRLPHEWEWQYAAQGTDGRVYPWGNEWPVTAGAGVAPKADTGRVMGPSSEVRAHPAGASPFGVMDMVGNVWQWTDEYTDTHTRAAILRGGSHYQPQGARWYFPQAYKMEEHGKYLLMAPSLDRSGAVGFRCVRDGQ